MLKGMDDFEADLLLDVLHSPDVGEGDHGAVPIGCFRRGRGRFGFEPVSGVLRCDPEIRELRVGQLCVRGDRSAVGVTRPVEIALVQEEPALEHEGCR